MTATIRLINPAFKQSDRNGWLTTSITINQAEAGIQSVSDNRWKQMVVWAVETGSMEGAEKFLKELFADVQKSVLDFFFEGRKRDTLSSENKENFNRYTSWFRSNRSVIKRAYEMGVDLLDGNNFPRGKSEVERDIAAKVKAEAEGAGKTEIDKFVALMATIQAVAGKIEDEADRKIALALTKNLEKVLRTGEVEF